MKPDTSSSTGAAVLAGLIALASTAGAEQHQRQWLRSFDDALAAAADGDRYILIDMWAEWCGWCQVLDQKVLSTPEFAEFARDFVLLRVDTVSGSEGAKLQKDYFVPKLPTTVIVNADRARVGSLTGMFPKEEYIEKLRQEIAKFERMVDFYDQVRSSDRADVQRQLAKELHERRDGKRAAGLFEKLYVDSDPGSEDAAWLAYYAADAHRLGREFDKARAHADAARDLARKLEHRELEEQIDLLDYYIARNAGDCGAAEASLEAFLDRHPDSSLRYDARRFLRELKRGDFADCRS